MQKDTARAKATAGYKFSSRLSYYKPFIKVRVPKKMLHICILSHSNPSIFSKFRKKIVGIWNRGPLSLLFLRLQKSIAKDGMNTLATSANRAAQTYKNQNGM